jgi:crotonobetainyl-CoA:carnitine CoA-transferase CaiB-like acyl-CoA transferase
MPPIFLAMNPGKRSVAIDLKHEQAKEIIHRLVARADVVVQNFKVGVIDRLGFGYEALKAIKPDLVYCAISGYGQEGPKAETAAYDGAIQAAAGMMSITGHKASGPARVGFQVVDMSTGLNAAFAIAAALYQRRLTGEGQYIDVAMFDTALTMMAPNVSDWLNSGLEPEQLGAQSQAKSPVSDAYPTRNGHLALITVTDDHWQKLCRLVGRAEWIADPRFSSNDARKANTEALRALLTGIFQTDDTGAWLERLSKAGVPAGSIATIPEAVLEPQLRHRNVLMTMRPSQGLGYQPTIFNAPFIFAHDTPGTDVPPPAVGEHTDQVLAEIGYDAADIAALRQAKAVG